MTVHRPKPRLGGCRIGEQAHGIWRPKHADEEAHDDACDRRAHENRLRGDQVPHLRAGGVGPYFGRHGLDASHVGEDKSWHPPRRQRLCCVRECASMLLLYVGDVHRFVDDPSRHPDPTCDRLDDTHPLWWLQIDCHHEMIVAPFVGFYRRTIADERPDQSAAA